MLGKLLWKLSHKLNSNGSDFKVHWHKTASQSWVGEFFKRDLNALPSPPMSAKIEDLALKASMLGELPLWEGFEKLEDYPFPVKNATRNANQVRVDKSVGDLFYNLVVAKKPTRIVEIGTAFGVSGMYWLSGINANGSGTLLTFDPNAVWAKIAQSNLSMISSNYISTVDTFEDTHNKILKPGEKIDMAFIDAIHQSGIVNNQFKLITQYCAPGSIILFDDINFSYDMWDCWVKIARSSKVKASCSIAKRIGIAELN